MSYNNESKVVESTNTNTLASNHRAITFLALLGLSVACFLLAALSALTSPRVAFVALFVLIALAIIGWQIERWHERYKGHQHHKHDLADRGHKREAITQVLSMVRELGVSAQIKYPDGSELNLIHPLAAAAAANNNINIKDVSMGQQQIAGASAQQPTLSAVIEDLTHNALQFAFGRDIDTGEIVTTTLQKAVHVQLLGATGQGKSHQAMSILTQLCATNDPEHLQLACIDCEGETSAPFWNLPHVRFLASDPKEAAHILAALVEELNRRDAKRQVWPMILVFVEEFLNLRRIMPVQYRDDALEDYTTIALRGRKRGIFLFAIGQTAYTERSIRDAQMQFMSSMAFAVKPSAARSAGFTNTELLNRLYSERKPGQFLLERPAGDGILVAPYVEPRAIPGLLSAFRVSSNPTIIDEFGRPNEDQTKTETKTGETALDARSRRIIDLVKDGVPQGQIINEIWGVRGGSAYTKAGQELANILKEIVQ